MQQRNTALTYYYFVLLLVGILLSTVSRRLEPLCAVLPLAVALLYSRMVRTTPMFTVHCQVTPQRAFEGDPITCGDNGQGRDRHATHRAMASATARSHLCGRQQSDCLYAAAW